MATPLECAERLNSISKIKGRRKSFFMAAGFGLNNKHNGDIEQAKMRMVANR
jgi:hypothetical protein